MATCTKRFARPLLFAVAAVLCGVSLARMPVRAQSAEETVAFMVWGLEEGAKTKRVTENVWEAEDPNGNRSGFAILRLTDCRFHISSEVQRGGTLDVLEFEYVLDFATVKDYSAWFANGRDQRIIVKIEGERWYSKSVRSRATGRAVQNITAGNVDAYVAGGGSVERLQSKFAHFRSTYCAGRSLSTDGSAKSQ